MCREPLQLFCFAHAGGAANRFAGWSRWLPDTVSVVPVDLPGHGIRGHEPAITRWPDLADTVVRTVEKRLDGPYALFGHSFGALVAFEIAAQLPESPELLIVAARNGPAHGLSHPPLSPLPDGQLVDALGRLGGTPSELLRERDLMDVMLPTIRADLALAETYVRPPRPALHCPIAAFAGRRDDLTDEAGLAAWQRETRAVFDLTVVDASHFFLDHPDFAAALATRIDRLGQVRQRTGQNSGSA